MPKYWFSDLAGQSGGIPISELEKKWEITEGVYEDESQVDDYQRDLVRDFGPDAPLFDSDTPSNGMVDPKTGAYRTHAAATSVLNLHHNGSRALPEPDHSEAFLGFTERDPRGTATDPDFRRLVAQSWIRGYDQNFRSDDDASVPESGRGHAATMRDIKAGFAATKNRMKFFETSKDTIVRGGLQPEAFHQQKSAATKATMDSETPELLPDFPWIYRDATTLLSNKLPVGYSFYTTPGQIFDVAQYGVPKRLVHQADVVKNKHASDAGVKFTQFQDQSVPITLALTMANLANERKHRQFKAPNIYGVSYDVTPRPVKFHADALVPATYARTSHPMAMHTQLDDSSIRLMTLSSKANAPTSNTEVARNIVETMIRGDPIADETANRSIVMHSDPTNLRQAVNALVQQSGVKPETTLANYRTIVPHEPINYGMNSQPNHIYTDSDAARVTRQRVSQLPDVRHALNYGNTGNEWGIETMKSNGIGGLAKPGVNHNIELSNKLTTDISEISTGQMRRYR